MAEFMWKTGFSPGIPANVAAEELERIRVANNGTILPQDVVEAARDDNAPLHDAFIWDDTVAAEEHRKSQARRLVSGLRVIRRVRNKTERTISYVSVRHPELGRGYRNAFEVMGEERLRERVILEAIEQLEGFRRRYAHLDELADVFRAIEDARKVV